VAVTAIRPASSVASRPATTWNGGDLLAVALLTAAGGALRLIRLAEPHGFVFDETYYAKDACSYTGAARSVCKVASEQTQVHPPLGKWIIAAGIKAFGFDSFGWRIAAALVGTATIALLYLVARKALASTVGATVAAGLLAVDPLAFVQARIAMLDVFVPFFGLIAILCLLRDRDRMLSSSRAGNRGPWRYLAGAAAGAATASKWSGSFFVVTVLVLTIAWARGIRRADGRGRPLRRALRQEGSSIVLGLVVVPLAVYVLSYGARLDGQLLALPWNEGSWLRALWDRQLYMLDFHRNLVATHPYTSPPWSWLLLKRPVSYYFDTAANGDYREILALGSPLAWWASIPALLYVGWRWAIRRDPAGPEGLIVAGFVLNYAPWLVLSGNRSAVFLFYLLPALPFMFMALGYVAARFERVPVMQPALALLCAGSIGLFAFYYPLLADVGIPRSAWLDRIWIFDNCDRPPQPETAGTKTSGESGDDSSSDLPPDGWCWI
jgi:dolichyl-phosphate-mannose-protein mannosyltransferase